MGRPFAVFPRILPLGWLLAVAVTAILCPAEAGRAVDCPDPGEHGPPLTSVVPVLPAERASGLVVADRMTLPSPFTHQVGRHPRLAMLAEEELVYAITGRNSLLIIDARTGALQEDLALGPAADPFAPDGLALSGEEGARRLVVYSLERGILRVYDLSSATAPVLLGEYTGCRGGISGIRLLPQAGALLSFGSRCARLLEIDSGRLLQDFHPSGDTVEVAVGGSWDTPLLALKQATGDVGTVTTFDLSDPKEPEMLATLPASHTAGAPVIDRRGEMLVVPGWTNRGRLSYAIYEARSGMAHSRLRTGPPPAEIVLADGGEHPVLAVAKEDGIDLFDLAYPERPRLVRQIDLSIFPQEGQLLSGAMMLPFENDPLLLVADPSDRSVAVIETTRGLIAGRWSSGAAVPAALTLAEPVGRDPYAAVVALRKESDTIHLPGGAAHLDLLDLWMSGMPRYRHRFESISLDPVDRFIVGESHRAALADPETNSLVVLDLATGSMVTGGFVDPGVGQLLAFNGRTVAAARTLPHRPAFEVQDLVGNELHLRVRGEATDERWGALTDLAVRGDDTVVLRYQRGLELVSPTGSRTLLPLNIDAPLIELSPDGKRILLRPEEGCPRESTFGVVEILDPYPPRLAWRGPPGARSARLVRSGAVVEATFGYGSGFWSALFDLRTGARLGRPGPAIPKHFHHGTATTFDHEKTAGSVFWRWTLDGWKTVSFEVSRGTPVMLAESREYLSLPQYAPRGDGAGWYQVHAQPAPWPYLVRLGSSRGALEDYGVVEPIEDLTALRYGFLVAHTPRAPRDLLVLRDPALNRRPEAQAGEDQVLECLDSRGTIVSLDGGASGDPDSLPGTADDIDRFIWTVGEFSPMVGWTVDIPIPPGNHRVDLVVQDKLGAEDHDSLHVVVQDTLSPQIDLSLEPMFEGSGFPELWRPLTTAVDQCFGVLAPPELVLSLENVVLEAHVSFSSQDDFGVTVYRTDEGIQVNLAGMDSSWIETLWARARDRGGLSLVHDTELRLLLREDIGEDEQGRRILAHYALDPAGTVIRAERFGALADHRFMARTRDLAGNQASKTVSLLTWVERECERLPTGILCEDRDP